MSVDSNDSDQFDATCGATEFPDAASAKPSAQSIDRVGRYRVLQQIGAGGMGQVFLAEQSEPVKRRVALKVIKTETPTKEVLARFEAERQALAMMDHHNIAKVLDAGVTEDGRPYFAMELVKGVPITDYCDSNKLNPDDRLELFVQTCRAIQHAHQKGIIHRDIKPSNVLVTSYDGKPVAKVIDFGLAKALQDTTQLTNRTLFTQYGQIIGTLAYMSPEQAEMNTLDVDTRTDVYSLGVILYELLTGSTPITRDKILDEAFDRILALIRSEEATRPSQRLSESGEQISGISEQRRTEPKRLSLILKGELDWIAVKALDKDRTRRYDTPAALADDICRYLNDEAIEARPPSTSYRLKKLMRKHTGKFVAGASILTLLVLGLVGTGTMWLRASSAESEARRAGDVATAEASRALEAEAEALDAKESEKTLRIEADRNLYLARINLAAIAWQSGDLDQLQRILQLCEQSPDRGLEWDFLNNQIRPYLTGHSEHSSSVKAVALSHDQSIIYSGDSVGQLIGWDLKKQRLLFSVKAADWGHVNSIALSSDGQSLAVACDQGRLTLYDPADGREQLVFEDGHDSQVFDVCFSSDGKSLLSAGADGKVILWSRDQKTPKRILTGHGPFVFSVAISPDSRRAASCGQDGRPQLWDLENGTRRELGGTSGFQNEIAFSPDGKYVAVVQEPGYGSSDASKPVLIWDADDPAEPILTVNAVNEIAHAIAFSPDAAFLAVGSDDGVARVVSVADGRVVRSLHGETGRVWDAVFSSDGTKLAVVGKSGVRLHPAFVNSAFAFVAESSGHILTSLDSEALVARRNVFAPGLLHRIAIKGDRPDEIEQSAYRIETRHDEEGNPNGFDVHGPDDAIVFSTDPKVNVSASPACLLNTPPLLVYVKQDKTCVLVDLKNGVELQQFSQTKFPVRHIRIDVESKYVFASTEEQTGRDNRVPKSEFFVWSFSESEPIFRSSYDCAIGDLSFHHEARLMAIARGDGRIDTWKYGAETVWQDIVGHPRGATSVVFSAAGDRLISGGTDRSLRIWDVASGQQLIELQGAKRAIASICISEDGSLIATSDGGPLMPGEILLWGQPRSEINPAEVRRWHVEEIRRAADRDDRFSLTWHSDQLLLVSDDLRSDDVAACCRAFLRTNQFDQALTWSQLAVDKSPEDSRVIEMHAALLEQLDRSDEAIKYLRQFVSLSPDKDTLYHLGNLEREAGDLAGAAKSFSMASKLSPDFAEAFCNLGQVLVRMGRFEEAANALATGHELGIKRRSWRYPSVFWLEEARELARLDKQLDSGTLPDSLTAQETYVLTRLGYIRNDDQVVKQYADVANENWQEDVFVESLKSQAFLIRSLVRRAVSDGDKECSEGLERLRETRGRLTEPRHYGLFDSLLRQGVELKQLMELRKSDRSENGHPDAWTRAINSLEIGAQAERINQVVWEAVIEGAGLTSDDIDRMEEVVRLLPRGLYFNTLGAAHFRMGNFAKSIEACLQSVDRTPKEMNLTCPHPVDLCFLAMSHFQVGDREKAAQYRAELDQAMKLDMFRNDEECLAILSEVNKLFGADTP